MPCARATPSSPPFFFRFAGSGALCCAVPPPNRRLQKMLRGRATQLRMFTGKERRCVLWRRA
jgi:hypothetical protein